ncbi:class I SAM-dependent methyltransferase [Kaistella sp.]|uniref:class I SAM-dependent methyltransferase n=1 Tax=Kaistella sp. TaxID=2782235 RepID=UPI002F94D031
MNGDKNMRIKIIKNNQLVINKSELKKLQLAELYLKDKYHRITSEESTKEIEKRPLRFEVINFILEKIGGKTTYLEIGVRNPEDNFDKINASLKYSVDPGYENEENNVDFKLTSDEFFEKLKSGNILNPEIKFDVVFIDGLHLADQVEKDITNSLNYLKEDGFIVMHDCNPPTEFHAAENYYYRLSPSGGYWNGTTWKAFFNTRKRTDIYSCCIDTDWGVGIISKKINLGPSTNVHNPYFEYYVMEKYRKESLNLVTFENFKTLVSK